MKDYTAYLLHFTAPLHLGNSRDDYGSSLTTLGSDGFYAALTATLASTGQQIPVGGDLGCTISSLFPFCQMKDSDSPRLFFPRPKSTEFPQTDPTQAKRIKKVEWLELSAFQTLLCGQDPFEHFTVHGKYLAQEGEAFDEDFISSQVTQRVSIDSLNRDTPPVPFYMDRLHFSGRSGLFFLCEGDTTILDRALPLLAANGIGTDRAVGNGYFDYEQTTVSLNLPTEAPLSVSLSTYIPASREEFDAVGRTPLLAYELMRLGGWCTTIDGKPLRRNPVHGFAAGSVFATTGHTTLGTIVDQRPSLAPHPVYRCGRALFLPLKPSTL